MRVLWVCLRHRNTRVVLLLGVAVVALLAVTHLSEPYEDPQLAELTNCCSNRSWFVQARKLGLKALPKVIDSAKALAKVDSELLQWRRNFTQLCGGRVTAYASKYAILREVILVPSLAEGKRRGGESMMEVLNQPEQDEFLRVKPGFLELPCNDAKPSNNFLPLDSPLNDLVNSIGHSNETQVPQKSIVRENNPTVLVQRHEYNNLYHTVTDWYNVFLMMVTFGLDTRRTQVLFLDAHPQGVLDETWKTLFNGFQRVAHLSTRVRYSRLVLAPWGYTSPISDFTAASLPLAEPFREFVLATHGLGLRKRLLRCDQLVVTMVLRRPYVSHPRNPTGARIQRRIFNEQQLVERLTADFVRTGRVSQLHVLQLETIPVSEQLRLVADTDVLIGMHGAGLTHTLFLPSHAAVIELAPIDTSGSHFRCIATWRQLHYAGWQNFSPQNELYGAYTRVPPSVLAIMLEDMLRKMKCDSAKTE